MKEDRYAWSRLPDALVELVLSFLPVPALCRIRCVCKAWNALCCKPKFLDLCDLNRGSMEEYMFLPSYVLKNSFRRTLCFLDLAEDRWYKIPTYNDDHDAATPLARLVDTEPCHLAGSDGLVCELCELGDNTKYLKDYPVILLDPIAKSRWELPALPLCHDRSYFSREVVRPALVTVVDTASSSFKVFFLHSKYNDSQRWSDTRFYVYESSSGVWRGLPNPPQRLGTHWYRRGVKDLEDSAVFFQGKFYTISYYSARWTSLVLSYSLQENEWSDVLAFRHKTKPKYPQLHVFNNRLFMGMSVSDPYVRSTSRQYRRHMYQVVEILVNKNSIRLWVQIPFPGLLPSGGFYSEGILQFALTFDSVVIVNSDFGEALAFNVKSQTFHELPRHPLEPSPDIEGGSFDFLNPLYRAKLITLSMRNILSRSDQNASQLQIELL